MKTLNPEIFKNPDLLLFEAHGPKGFKELLYTVILIIAGITLVYMGITPERRSYRFGVYVTLPDPNWFLFGIGIVVLVLSLFFFIHFINVHFCNLKIKPGSVSGYGVVLAFVHLVLPVNVDIQNVSDIEEKGSYLQVNGIRRKIRFYLNKDKEKEAFEILSALKEHYSDQQASAK